ncbi:MAG TPA: endonuclease/exonuclease/phosphatase family protein, partial [Marmoricola sp.]|nr:endonuclease/exonuclease/phosphatase family protein [Marmoricola sp.]
KHAPRPLLVVGDLNVTGDSLPFKELTKLGLRDAAIGAGSGWQPTWPSKLGPLALLTLDHVLFSDDFEVAKTTTVRVPGSDHLALIADLLGPA